VYRRTNIEIMPDREFDAGIKPYLSDDDYLTLQETFTEAAAQAIYPHPESELAAPYAQDANVYEATEYSWQLGIEIGWPDLPQWQWNLDLPEFQLPEFPPWTWPSLPPWSFPAFPPWAWPTLPPINWDFTWPDLPSWWWPSLPPITWPDLPSWDIRWPPWAIQWPDFGLMPYTPPGLPSISPWPELGELPDVGRHYQGYRPWNVCFSCDFLDCYCPGKVTCMPLRCSQRVIGVEFEHEPPRGIGVSVVGGQLCVAASEDAHGSFEVNIVMVATVNDINGPKQIVGRAYSKNISECPKRKCTTTCDCSLGLNWNTNISAETIAPNSEVTVDVIDLGGHCGPFVWIVSGTGFSLAAETTFGTSNTLIADATACGSAMITVIGCDGSSVTGYVRSTEGRWGLDSGKIYPPQYDCCYGAPGLTCVKGNLLTKTYCGSISCNTFGASEEQGKAVCEAKLPNYGKPIGACPGDYCVFQESYGNWRIKPGTYYYHNYEWICN
jgi:hypothetical protein